MTDPIPTGPLEDDDVDRAVRLLLQSIGATAEQADQIMECMRGLEHHGYCRGVGWAAERCAGVAVRAIAAGDVDVAVAATQIGEKLTEHATKEMADNQQRSAVMMARARGGMGEA